MGAAASTSLRSCLAGLFAPNRRRVFRSHERLVHFRVYNWQTSTWSCEFCRACCDQWVKSQHRDCPSCRMPFKPSKLRALLPWEGGLRLKDVSSAEQNALRELEEARQARSAMEKRAATAESAMRQYVRAEEARAAAARAVEPVDATECAAATAVAAAASTSTASAPHAPGRASTCAALQAPPAAAPAAGDTALPVSPPPEAAGTSTLTEAPPFTRDAPLL